MDAKEYCNHIMELHGECSRRRKVLERIKEDCQVNILRSPTYEGSATRSGRWSGGVYNRIESHADRVREAELWYASFLTGYIRELMAFDRKVKRIREKDVVWTINYQNYLSLRYGCGLPVTKVAEQMGFEYPHVAHMLQPALAALQVVLDQEEISADNL